MAPKLPRSILYGSVMFVCLSSIAVSLFIPLASELKDGVCWDRNERIINYKDSFVLVVMWLVYTWCIPNFIIIIVYCLIARALKANTLKHANNRAMEQRIKQNSRIFKMFIIITIIFFTFTMPIAAFYCYTYYMYVYDPQNPRNKDSNTINYILFIPAAANGCVNPLIYAKMQREINRYLRSLIHMATSFCCHCVQKSDVNRSSQDSTGRPPSSASFENTKL